MRILYEYKKNNVNYDLLSCTFSDPTESYGLIQADNKKIILPAGVPLQRVSTGRYIYNIQLDPTKKYIYYIKAVTKTGNIEYIMNIIEPEQQTIPPQPIFEPKSAEGYEYTEVDIDGDGIIDGYAYDIDGYVNGELDGYAESFDLNFDKKIDALDLGTVKATNNFDYRGVRKFPDGNIRYTGLPTDNRYNIDPTPDGIPDVPSPKGKPDDTGTFANTYGYDGIDGTIPATGGARTNRDRRGTGYWDGISFKDTCTKPIGPRGMCIKDKALAMTRVMLKDTYSKCVAFTDDELDLQLELSLASFNAYPTFTSYTWDTLPESFLSVIIKGAVVWSLYSQGLIEAGREFVVNENGIQFTPPPVSDKMHSYASSLLQQYNDELKRIKDSIVPRPFGVGVLNNMTAGFPQIRTLTTLLARRIG